ncbi:tetratricopeptide repeat protein [Chitinimonas sp.]|uniref:tetratricopeptide repeat protein n=1 Tax=Chitinimonas sp. TaxID=1934313 RepID=UPI0035B1F42D
MSSFCPTQLRRIWPALASLLLGALTLNANALDVQALWDFERPELSEQRFRDALRRPDIDGIAEAELLSQLARAQGMQGQFDLASRTLDQVQARLAILPPASSVSYSLERGRLAQQQGDGKRAWRWYHSALLLAQKHQLDMASIDAMRMLALSSSGKIALDWYLKALALAERGNSAQAIAWQPMFYNNIGWLYVELKDTTRALDYLRKAQAWQEKRGDQKSVLVARWGVGRVLRLSKQVDAALDIQLTLEQDWKRLREEDGYVYEEIAECLLAQGRDEEAALYFAKAYRVLSQDPWLQRQDAARIARMRQLSG